MDKGAYTSEELQEIEKGKVDSGLSRLEQLKKELEEHYHRWEAQQLQLEELISQTN